MGKIYTVTELRDMGMDDAQINAILCTQRASIADNQLQAQLDKEQEEKEQEENKVVYMHKHDVEVHTSAPTPLVPTSISQLETYKNGSIVELPPFADGQPLVVRMTRPSLPTLIKTGRIPNTLMNQASALFSDGVNALNKNGKNSTNISELYDIIESIIDAALLEPTLEEIHSVGMELTDEQLMAAFSYTQRGVKALEQFRTI